MTHELEAKSKASRNIRWIGIFSRGGSGITPVDIGLPPPTPLPPPPSPPPPSYLVAPAINYLYALHAPRHLTPLNLETQSTRHFLLRLQGPISEGQHVRRVQRRGRDASSWRQQHRPAHLGEISSAVFLRMRGEMAPKRNACNMRQPAVFRGEVIWRGVGESHSGNK